MSSRSLILILALLLATSHGISQERGRITSAQTGTKAPATPDCVRADTIGTMTPNNIRLYDSIRAKTSRRAVPRMLYDMLFIAPQVDTISHGQALDESRLFAPYSDLTIGSITIERDQVFDKDGNRFERAGNKVHALTREHVIRRDLLFKSGDMIDPELLVRNKQLLLSRPYISDAWIELRPDSLDSTRIDILVRTRDSWTISADLSLNGDNRTMFSLYDANILGTGNKLTIKTHFNRETFNYDGNIVSYELPNVLGTFYRAELSAGRDAYNSELKISLYKNFILPTDYEAGISYNDIKSKYYRTDLDTSELIRVRNFDLWGGRSTYIKSIGSSIFITGHYGLRKHTLRPDVAPNFNPAFHNYNNLLFGLGLYRERFYSANMVYGFGTREYLATGYKAEITGGYSWGEFAERMYFGAGIKGGDFFDIGYLMGSISAGGLIDIANGSWHQGIVDMDLRWFSNLVSVRRNRLRQFLSFNYTQGWNRSVGSNELLRFTKTNGLRTLRYQDTGINRMVLNTETVIFTPFQPLGFHFAFYAFADFGLLGYEANPFCNEFFSSFGLGVRIKNERLIFSAVQIQLGFSVGKQGWLDSRYFGVSNQTRLEKYRYQPIRPEITGFE